MYYLQTLLLGAAAGFFMQSRGKLRGTVAAILVIWIFGVSAIYFRYGWFDQLSFYQNDQLFHWQLISQFGYENLQPSFDSINYFRLPYTAPAYVLKSFGFDPTLALKFVSLCCALAVMTQVENQLRPKFGRYSYTLFLLTAGPMLLFFSLLALRETMMALCVTTAYITTSQPKRLVSLICLLVLRPHLAAAVVFGFGWGWFVSRVSNRLYIISLLVTSVAPITAGTIGFALGNFLLERKSFRLDQSLFLRDEIIQVFSAFAGLQFLTVAQRTVEFSTSSLLVLRAVFPEIFLIPICFTIACLINTPKTTRLKLSVLATFVFFTAVSSGTQFLSVRQSLPLMPIMGLVVLHTIHTLRTNRDQTRSLSIREQVLT